MMPSGAGEMALPKACGNEFRNALERNSPFQNAHLAFQTASQCCQTGLLSLLVFSKLYETRFKNNCFEDQENTEPGHLGANSDRSHQDRNHHGEVLPFGAQGREKVLCESVLLSGRLD